MDSNINDKIKELRDIFSEKFDYFYNKKGFKEWNILCASMDNIESSFTAIKHFRINGFGNDSDKERGQKYLNLYGVMQSFIILQDSLKQFYSIIENKKLSNSDFVIFNKLRELRVEISGHPMVAHYAKYSCNVPPHMIKKYEFHLVKYDNLSDETKFSDINLLDYYDDFIVELSQHVDNLIDLLNEVCIDKELNEAI